MSDFLLDPDPAYDSPEAAVCREAIEGCERDLLALLNGHAAIGADPQVLLHALTEVTGLVMLSWIAKNPAARVECVRLAELLAMVVAPQGKAN